MNIFLQFPQMFDEDKSILRLFSHIQSRIKDDKSIRLHYAIANFEDFKNSNEESEVYLLSEISLLRSFIFSSNSYQINSNENEVAYIQWNLDKYECQSCNIILRKIAEEIYRNSDYKYLLVNFGNSIATCRNKILVFRDNKYLNFPDYFLKIDFVTDEVEFFEWLKTNSIKDFSLRDEQRFQKRPDIVVKGATVYFEIKERRYWHLDTFHEYVEYEVYDYFGIHIATANGKGELNPSKKKPGRRLFR